LREIGDGWLAAGRGLQSLSKLRILRLDFNLIAELSSQQLLCCSQLTSLDLSSNRLASLVVSVNYVTYLFYSMTHFVLLSVLILRGSAVPPFFPMGNGVLHFWETWRGSSDCYEIDCQL